MSYRFLTFCFLFLSLSSVDVTAQIALKPSFTDNGVLMKVVGDLVAQRISLAPDETKVVDFDSRLVFIKRQLSIKKSGVVLIPYIIETTYSDEDGRVYRKQLPIVRVDYANGETVYKFDRQQRVGAALK